MRLLYIHSFQSFIWNHAVTERIKRFGLEPVEGDIILIKEEIQEVEIGEADMNCEGHSNEVKNNQEVKALTVEDLKNYTIYDVVLPLPGYDILYPEFMKDFYKNILEKYGLSLEMPKQSVKTYTLSGTYRKIVSEVKDISWKILRYNLPTDNLIRSDFEELRGFSEPKDVENGQFKALVMTFSLKSSSYATMVLREIMKVDTSTSAQAKLNNYFLPTDQSQPSNSKKIIIDSENNVEEDNKFCEMSEGSSLLADKEKYNDFKNNIFNIINEPVKRKMDEDDGDESDEVKKVKIDGIKMEASMV